MPEDATKPLLEKSDTNGAAGQSSTKERIISGLVMTSCFLSFALAAGFNFGIAGSLVVSVSKRFNVDLNVASWSPSVHTVFFLMSSKYAATLIYQSFVGTLANTILPCKCPQHIQLSTAA